MELNRIMNIGLMSFAILSLVALVAALTATNRATFPELGVLAIVNVVSAALGLARLMRVKGKDAPSIEKIGKIGAQHSWLTFSVTTAVLALLFGKYFSDNMTTMVIQYIMLTVISLVSVYLIVVVASRKIYFLD